MAGYNGVNLLHLMCAMKIINSTLFELIIVDSIHD